jgi:hypothetical protein
VYRRKLAPGRIPRQGKPALAEAGLGKRRQQEP